MARPSAGLRSARVTSLQPAGRDRVSDVRRDRIREASAQADALRCVKVAPGGFALHPIGEGAGISVRPAAGLASGDKPIRFASDGRSVFASRSEGLTVRVFSVDTTTGSRRLLREFRPADAAGMLGPGGVDLTPDARFWVHGYMRDLSDFYVIDGLR